MDNNIPKLGETFTYRGCLYAVINVSGKHQLIRADTLTFIGLFDTSDVEDVLRQYFTGDKLFELVFNGKPCFSNDAPLGYYRRYNGKTIIVVGDANGTVSLVGENGYLQIGYRDLTKQQMGEFLRSSGYTYLSPMKLKD